jgi:hypothetical protein
MRSISILLLESEVCTGALDKHEENALAAAGLDVPIIGLGYVYQHGLPFTTRSRYTCFKKGDGPETIMAEVKRFVRRLSL